MNEIDTQLTQVLLQIVITAIVPAISGFVVMWIRAQMAKVRMQLTAEQRQYADAVIRNLIAAAEQYDLAGLVKRSGAQKKAWVVGQAQTMLDSAGIHWEAQTIADLVEAKILEGAARSWPELPSPEPVDTE